MNSRTMYIRDTNWNPTGCVVINVDHQKNRAEYQLAVLNPNDRDLKTGRRLRFDRRLSRLLAMERLLEKPITVSLPENANQHQISHAIMTSLAANKAAPARAVKFAKLWLRSAHLLHHLLEEEW